MHACAALLCLLSLALASGCKAPARPGPPPDPKLIQVPDGYGRPYSAEVSLSVRDRLLLLPGGRRCGLTDIGCAQALAALRGKAVALELDPALAMADLTMPLSRLSEALEDGAAACLAVSDSRERRCVAFRPFSGEEFGAWLDAEKPLGKLRVIMRADGFEVVADRGKVPGPDRFGPSLPPIGGRPDFDGLDRMLGKLARRFPEEDQAALAPSPGLRLRDVGRALGLLSGLGGERFPRAYLVFP